MRCRRRTAAAAVAGVATAVLTHLQLDAAPGGLTPLVGRRPDRRSIVHQAAGMVSVQLDLPISDAQARLRAHAFAEGIDVAAVAADIVSQRLRLAR